MKIQNGLKKDSSLAKFVVGAHPIIEHFVEMLRIREIIGTYVRTDKRMKLDDGKVLTLLIHNILTTPNPLYEMEDWLKPLDAEKLGLSLEETKWIQDDRIGRALARFYDSRHKDVFFRLALRAIKLIALDCRRIHHDTTSVTLVGKYGGWNAKERLAFGKNKDHRPDLKQLVLGLNVTADGAVPISHRIYDGNQTDDRIHPANHRALQKLLGRADFIYVADCKLATKENLQKISVWHGRFVSVMPRTWKEDEPSNFANESDRERSSGNTSCRGGIIANQIQSLIATTWRRVTTKRLTGTVCTGSAAHRRQSKIAKHGRDGFNERWSS